MALKDKISKCRETGMVDGRELKCQRFEGHTGVHATAGGKVWRNNGEAIKPSVTPKLISIEQRKAVNAFTEDDINLVINIDIELSREFTETDLDGERVKLKSLAEKIKILREVFGIEQ